MVVLKWSKKPQHFQIGGAKVAKMAENNHVHSI